MIKNSNIIAIYLFSCLFFNVEYTGQLTGIMLICISWLSEIASSTALERMTCEGDYHYVIKAVLIQFLSYLAMIKNNLISRYLIIAGKSLI